MDCVCVLSCNYQEVNWDINWDMAGTLRCQRPCAGNASLSVQAIWPATQTLPMRSLLILVSITSVALGVFIAATCKKKGNTRLKNMVNLKMLWWFSPPKNGLFDNIAVEPRQHLAEPKLPICHFLLMYWFWDLVRLEVLANPVEILARINSALLRKVIINLQPVKP